MSSLRHYVRVYDDVLAPDRITELYDEVINVMPATPVDIPLVTRYTYVPISPLPATRKFWLSLSHHFVAMLGQYKVDVGIQHEPRWSEDVMEGFSFRRYDAKSGFQENMFDARSETTSPLFMSAFYFLNDAPDFYLHFDQSVSFYQPIQARAGRLVIWPSSWLYPYTFKTGEHDVDVIKATLRWCEPKA